MLSPSARLNDTTNLENISQSNNTPQGHCFARIQKMPYKLIFPITPIASIFAMASAIYLRIFGVFVPKKGQKQEILQKMRKKLRKNLQIKKYGVPLHSQSKNIAHVNFKCTAEIAQLVEHNLAKVGVASSSLVFRSK